MNFNYNLPLKFNFPTVQFRSNPTIKVAPKNPTKDGFVSNPLYETFGTKTEIEETAKTNPRIQAILRENNLQLQVNVEELEKLKQGHLNETRVVAAQIYSSLSPEIKQKVSLPDLQTAAMFHDYGKVLIPKNILNKTGKLTDEERKIMELHSELGYELLRNKGLSEKTLNLVKYHHQNLKGDGYPQKGNDFEYGIDTQILTMADKYTALREKRSYKNPLGKYEALEIIAKDVNNGQLSQEVYTALIKGV